MTIRSRPGKPMRKDADGYPIQGGQSVVRVFTVTLTNTAWAAVTIPDVANLAAKFLLVGERSGGAWKMSYDEDGTAYITFLQNTAGKPFELRVAPLRGDTVFYAQSSGASGTLEVAIID